MNTGNYADVNGLQLYFERLGDASPGRVPLVLIHGGFGATLTFAHLIPHLAATRPVITVDLQAHGRTADIDRPMHFASLADGVAALLRSLNIEQADVLGYSVVGGAALRCAIQHPDLVRKLIVLSFPAASTGYFPDVVAQQRQIRREAAEHMKGGPLFELYARLAADPAGWPDLVHRVGELMGRAFDWTADIGRIRASVLLVSGDADMVSPAHMVAFFALLGGGQRDAGWNSAGLTRHRLAILPATTHYAVLQSPLLPEVVAEFLASTAPDVKATPE